MISRYSTQPGKAWLMKKLKSGKWNDWRIENPEVKINLCKESFKGRKDLSGIDFSGANLEYADFSDAILDGANFNKANLYGAKFGNASLFEISFVEAKMLAVFLDNARAEQGNFSNAVLSSARFLNAALEGALFRGAFIVATNFKGAKLADSIFADAVIDQTIFKDADIRLARFAYCNPRHNDHVLTASSGSGYGMYLVQRKGGVNVEAGCRFFKSIAQARRHWRTENPRFTKKHYWGGNLEMAEKHLSQCNAALDFLVSQARSKGWKFDEKEETSQ